MLSISYHIKLDITAYIRGLDKAKASLPEENVYTVYHIIRVSSDIYIAHVIPDNYYHV